MHVKKGDKVIVIAGKDKGKSGVIAKAMPSIDKVIVDGINMVKKHVKKSRTAAGQLIDKAMPIHVSNVKLADGKKAKAAKPAKKTAKKVAKKEA